jgi:hypothetical protein
MPELSKDSAPQRRRPSEAHDALDQVEDAFAAVEIVKALAVAVLD